MIRLVALDMAGTTIDEGGAVYEALRQAVAGDELNRGAEVSMADVQVWMGADKRAAMAELSRLASGADADGPAVERMYARFRSVLAAAYEERPPKAIDGVPELFARLRSAGVKVALTTGFARDVADPLLATLGWGVGADGQLDAVVCADEVAAGRPAPYLIFRAMERTGVESVAEVVVAGDTVVDLRAGINAGVRAVIGVTTGKLGYAELAAEEHTHLLPSVTSLDDLLPRLSGPR